jgi:hypothetical protein
MTVRLIQFYLHYITAKFLSKHCIKRVLDTEMNGYHWFNFTEKHSCKVETLSNTYCIVKFPLWSIIQPFPRVGARLFRAGAKNLRGGVHLSIPFRFPRDTWNWWNSSTENSNSQSILVCNSRALSTMSRFKLWCTRAVISSQFSRNLKRRLNEDKSWRGMASESLHESFPNSHAPGQTRTRLARESAGYYQSNEQ